MRTALILSPVLLLLAAPGCAHAPRPRIREAAAGGDCEAAAAHLARHPPRQTAGDELRRVLAQPMSWAVSGLGYAADGTILFAGGLVAGGLGCVPFAALDAAFGSDGDAEDSLYAQCFVGVAGAVMGSGLPGAGRGLARATRRWRCPDLTRLARETRAVAACYRRRGTRADLEKAWDLVAALGDDPRAARCLSHRERRADARALEAVEAALEAAWDGPPPPPPPPPGATGAPPPPAG